MSPLPTHRIEELEAENKPSIRLCCRLCKCINPEIFPLAAEATPENQAQPQNTYEQGIVRRLRNASKTDVVNE